MSQKKTPVKKDKAPQKSDPTVYLVVAAFVMMVASLIVLRQINSSYRLDGGFMRIYKASYQLAWFCLGTALISLGLLIALRNRIVRAICPYTLVLSLLWALTASVLRNYWINQMVSLYLLHASVYSLFMVYELYRAEFFCVSLATVAAGVCFYLYHVGLGPNLRCVLIGVTLVLVLLGVMLVSFSCGKNKGVLSVRGRQRRIFPKSFNPLMCYITCLVWFVCFVFTLILGPAFAYYCIFAAVAYELVAAVYYTFQLK